MIATMTPISATSDVVVVYVVDDCPARCRCIVCLRGPCIHRAAQALAAEQRRRVETLDFDDLSWLSAWIHERADESAAKQAHSRPPAATVRKHRMVPRPRSRLRRPMRAAPLLAA
jgi:hypothetical protein